MRFSARDSVRTLLPVVVLGLCHGCGGGGGSGGAAPPVSQSSPGAPAPAPAPAPTPSPTPAPAPPPANAAPTIAVESPQDAQVGVAYEFQPSATDADGDTLAFSATNLPAWAQFDQSSGRITGTPGAADVGSHEAITITVADATHQTASPPFAITVNGSGSGVATLSWQPPMSKVDGSTLDDLAGYRIRYGRDPEDLDHSIFIGDPAQTSFEFSTLGSGIWHFAVIAINAGGEEGPPTPTATKSI